MQPKRMKSAAHGAKSSVKRSGKVAGSQKVDKVEKAVAKVPKFFADVKATARRHAEEEIQ